MITRKYLSFDELSDRWSCEKKEIHYLISEGDLVPSIAWDDWAISCQWEPAIAPQDGSVLCQVKDENGCHEMAYLRGWVYLQRPVITGPFDNYRFIYASYYSVPPTDEFRPGVLYRLGRDGDYAQVTALFVETNGAFMINEVEFCESIRHPGIFESVESKKQSEGKHKAIVEDVDFSLLSIKGPTFQRLQRAIALFPSIYTEYKSKPPKLDDDVRKWLENSGLGKNEPERRVFGAILREHFELSPDTQKIK